MIFAIAMVLIIPLVFALFDLYTWNEQRDHMQDALDAAALAAARSSSVDDAVIDQIGDRVLLANLKLIRGASLVTSDFHLSGNGVNVDASATIRPLPLMPGFWANPPIVVTSQVVRASQNLEVALVLDVTGSMAGTKIADLRSAAQDLVDIVVRQEQTPFYSKVALVPWSMGVNAGAYADSVRGAVTGTRSITDIGSWKAGPQRAITGATKTNPVVVTAPGHGFSNGNVVLITGEGGMSELNGRPFVVAGATSNTFQLSGVDGRAYSSYQIGHGGNVAQCARADCTMTVTAAAHGYANGDRIYINNVTPAALGTDIDDTVYKISGVTANTFNIFVPTGPVIASGHGGDAYCTKYGCEYYWFRTARSDDPGDGDDDPDNDAGGNNYYKLFRNSSCVSERTGAQAYTDAATVGAPVGFSYPAPASGVSYAGYSASTPNPCLTNQIIPLTTDKAAVKSAIGVLQAQGSTAGQIGVAWGWYMVSPHFGAIFPSASRPAAYTQPNTLKAVVLMTDGALNSPYCNGVIARDALTGSGSSRDHRDCNATNGTTLSQSLALCQAMKNAGVIVYTVGFQITGDTNAETLINTCPSSPRNKYLPTSGQALSEAFKSIGADLNNLRISRRSRPA